MDKPKFNLLDGIILLLIVAIAAAGIFLFAGGNGGDTVVGTQNTQAVFKIQLTRVDESLYEKFRSALDSGESVWVGIKERFEGKIEELEFGPSTRITTDMRSGKAKLSEDPTAFDLTVTINAAAVENDGSISASGTPIRVGEETSVRGKGFAGFGFVIDLKTVADAVQQ